MIGLPPEWSRDGYALRPETPADHGFQRTLFALGRPDAHLIALWPPPQAEAFLDQQFTFQNIHYRRFYDGADFLIVTRHGNPVGRVILHREPRDWRLVDIGIMPDRRGQGLGTVLLKALQAACAGAGAQALSLNVEHGNKARELYARLGFAATEDNGTHVEMTWQTAADAETAA